MLPVLHSARTSRVNARVEPVAVHDRNRPVARVRVLFARGLERNQVRGLQQQVRQVAPAKARDDRLDLRALLCARATMSVMARI